jgi:hypothetical protein
VRNFDWLPFTPPLVVSSVLHSRTSRISELDQKVVATTSVFTWWRACTPSPAPHIYIEHANVLRFQYQQFVLCITFDTLVDLFAKEIPISLSLSLSYFI